MDAIDLDTLYIDYAGPTYPVLHRTVAGMRSALLGRIEHRLELDSVSRRNPRTAEYMNALAASTTESPTIVRITGPNALDVTQIAAARDIVLLWRDANGCGWSSIERLVLRHKRRECVVRVLNGRRRLFDLTAAVRRDYAIRRFLEKSLLPEMGAFAVFVLVSPVLVAWDVVRGRS